QNIENIEENWWAMTGSNRRHLRCKRAFKPQEWRISGLFHAVCAQLLPPKLGAFTPYLGGLWAHGTGLEGRQ
ncbi:hypothetical protein, partial [Mesorhizobium sp.]|uniref:hypothetical protein n=1 Tax=Mesorhizobium sp. TaxID=1871066 RepID=UPI0025C3EDC2